MVWLRNRIGKSVQNKNKRVVRATANVSSPQCQLQRRIMRQSKDRCSGGIVSNKVLPREFLWMKACLADKSQKRVAEARHTHPPHAQPHAQPASGPLHKGAVHSAMASLSDNTTENRARHHKQHLADEVVQTACAPGLSKVDWITAAAVATGWLFAATSKQEQARHRGDTSSGTFADHELGQAW
jgi:hypothetical protein